MTKQTIDIGAVADDGTGDTLRDAFDKVNDNFNETMGGTAFPGTPANGDRYYRTDRRIGYQYDGTRWLSEQVFALPLPPAVAMPVTATTSALLRAANPWWNQYAILVESIIFSSVLSAGTSDWTAELFKWDAASSTSMGTASTSGDPATTFVNDAVTPAAGPALVASSVEGFTVTATENSGAGNLWLSAAILYRLVG